MATDLFDVFAEEDVLTFGYYTVALVATLGALFIWPSADTRTVSGYFSRRGRR